MINAKHLAIALFLISGTISTFSYKLQGTQIVTEGPYNDKKCFHPYMQSLSMFIGESLCLLVYFAESFKSKNHQKSQVQQKLYKPYIFIIPALADSLSSMLQYMGLSFIPSSTYMMLKGASIVTTALFSKLLFNMEIQKRHIIGCTLAIIGITVVGSSALFSSGSSNTNFNNQLIGYALMLISLIFNGFFYAYQQKLMQTYNKKINVLEMVGYEGIFGICIISIFLCVLSFIPCSFGKDGCVFTDDGNSYWERPQIYLREAFDNWFMILLVVSGIIFIAVYNLNGLKITKYFDALARALLNVTKTSVVWILGIIITLFANGNQQFILQPTDIFVILVKAIGFVIIIFGTLVYNKLIFKDYLSKNYPLLTYDQSENGEDESTSQISQPFKNKQ